MKSFFKFISLITDIIGDIQSSVMIMLNAIYFNGEWRHSFLPNNTIDQPFFINPTTQIRTKFMTQTNNFYFFESNRLNAKILRLPYKVYKILIYKIRKKYFMYY